MSQRALILLVTILGGTRAALGQENSKPCFETPAAPVAGHSLLSDPQEPDDPAARYEAIYGIAPFDERTASGIPPESEPIRVTLAMAEQLAWLRSLPEGPAAGPVLAALGHADAWDALVKTWSVDDFSRRYVGVQTAVVVEPVHCPTLRVPEQGRQMTPGNSCP